MTTTETRSAPLSFMMTDRCLTCSDRRLEELGQLGNLYWVRCRACGATQSITNESEPDSVRYLGSDYHDRLLADQS